MTSNLLHNLVILATHLPLAGTCYGMKAQVANVQGARLLRDRDLSDASFRPAVLVL